MPLLTQSCNGIDDYYYIIIYASTYAIASFFNFKIVSLNVCVFLIVLKYHLFYSYVEGKLYHIVSIFPDNPRCPWFHPSFDEVASSRLQGSDSNNNGHY